MMLKKQNDDCTLWIVVTKLISKCLFLSLIFFNSDVDVVLKTLAKYRTNMVKDFIAIDWNQRGHRTGNVQKDFIIKQMVRLKLFVWTWTSSNKQKSSTCTQYVRKHLPNDNDEVLRRKTWKSYPQNVFTAVYVKFFSRKNL